MRRCSKECIVFRGPDRVACLVQMTGTMMAQNSHESCVPHGFDELPLQDCTVRQNCCKVSFLISSTTNQHVPITLLALYNIMVKRRRCATARNSGCVCPMARRQMKIIDHVPICSITYSQDISALYISLRLKSVMVTEIHTFQSLC